MAQTRTPKGTAAAKAEGDTLTIPDVSMVGGDALEAAVAWDSSVSGNPEVKLAGKELEVVKGETINGKWRLRVYSAVINNTRTKDLVVTWPTANLARCMIASCLHQGGLVNLARSSEDLAATVSSTGAPQDPDHITTLQMAFHCSNGPVGDLIGSSSTGHTLGQRIGTSGGDDDSNLTIQEAYKFLVATTVAAGSFVPTRAYQIKTVGTTDFTAIGAADNNVGTQFTATGAGTGTGDAYWLNDQRSRITGLTNRDHMAVHAMHRPVQSFTIKRMEQLHRNMNHNPDWVMVEVEDEAGKGFEFPIDPDLFDGWSDTAVADYIAKFASIWVTNIIDSNLSYEVDAARDARMAGFVDDQVIL